MVASDLFLKNSDSLSMVALPQDPTSQVGQGSTIATSAVVEVPLHMLSK
jgi:hypothetical protein